MSEEKPKKPPIECHYCPAKLERGPDVSYSGWQKYGQVVDGLRIVVSVCPKCQREHGL